ncbi:hypothetical protein H9P43_001468 [Blastocladiella emersonii ATCC 22665]|nr:hypothetical protein H9P43_001468 [Blastocladiella emersonii ATCC 22665]
MNNDPAEDLQLDGPPVGPWPPAPAAAAAAAAPPPRARRDTPASPDSDSAVVTLPSDDPEAFDHALGEGTTHLPADRSQMVEFITSPIPQFERIQCRIFRHRDGVGKFLPGYEVFLEHGHQQIFLMSARKKTANKGQGSCYAVYSERLQIAGPDNLLCKVRSNFLGTAFTVTAPVASPSATATAASDAVQQDLPTFLSAEAAEHRNDGGSGVRVGSWLQGKQKKDKSGSASSKERKWYEELAAVLYEPNILGFKGPRKMTILLPTMTMQGERVPIIPTSESETLLGRMKAGNDPRLLVLHNKTPQWNEETHSYVLNFNGRVTVASVKNFQVVHDNDIDYIVMQFGRAEETFSMDAQYPLTPLQALGICLSSFDAKLACE